MKIKVGDIVLIVSPDQKTFLVRIDAEKKLHTHLGILDHADFLNLEFGETVSSTLDRKFYVLKPTLEDIMMKVRRRTQIIYPKDAAVLIVKTGIQSGMKVIECATGSGVFTICLAHTVYPHGTVYTYEKKKEFLDNALENIKFARLQKNVKHRVGDCRDGFAETDADAVFLDIPFPWEGVPSAARSLAGGGTLASVSPTINQVEKTVESMSNEGFILIETLEVLTRKLKILTGRSRPDDRMIGHTAYLTIGRKTKTDISDPGLGND